MASFEAIRDRLPSLYRPEDDEVADERLPFATADVARVVADGPARLRGAGGLVTVELSDGARLRQVVLVPGRAPGLGYALVLYPFAGDEPSAHAFAVLALRDGVARVPASVEFPRFALELRRRSPLTGLLQSIGSVLDTASLEAESAMRAHWFDTADRALFDGYFQKRRPEPAVPGDPDLQTFPHVRDLARIGSLLTAPPWSEPPADSELVEAYGERLARLVQLYAGGLGTARSLRRMVELQLPVDPTLAPERRDRPVSVEEPGPGPAVELAVPDLVGPLMHWDAINPGPAAVPVTVEITGVAPVPREVAATELPAIESGRLALGYRGTVAPDATLRLRPAYSSWLAGADGVSEAFSEHPTAAGPWTAATAGPPGPVRALLRAQDGVIWAAAGSSEVWRLTGAGWSRTLTGLDAACLAEQDDFVLVGGAGGVSRVAQHPPDGTFAATPLFSGPVNALLVDDGGVLAGTPAGLVRDGAPWERAAIAFDVRALARDGADLLVGGSGGVFLFQRAFGRWDPITRSLPLVLALYRAADSTLWIGTDRGLARFVGRRREQDLRRTIRRGQAASAPDTGGAGSLETALEAFPDLVVEPVRAIAPDERGNVWFATGRGVLRADGRDLAQHVDGAWVPLGRIDSMYTPDPESRGTWRWVTTRWERNGLPFTTPPRTAAAPAVLALAWGDSLAADLDGTPVALSEFVTRVKMSDTVIADAGPPALPRLRAGSSTWRFLSLEPPGLEPPAGRPWWSSEGRRVGELPAGFGDARIEVGRFDTDQPPRSSQFDRAAFAYLPAAAVRMSWSALQPLTVVVRVRTAGPDDVLDPLVIDRVWRGIEQARPAGVRVLLAVDETIVRGEDRG